MLVQKEKYAQFYFVKEVQRFVKKFFAQRLSLVASSEVTSVQIEKYRHLVVLEMQKMGASEKDIKLLQEATILNSINNKRRPEDVAWAILQ